LTFDSLQSADKGQQESRATAAKPHDALHCKIRYMSKFAWRGSPCDSTTFLYKITYLHHIFVKKIPAQLLADFFAYSQLALAGTNQSINQSTFVQRQCAIHLQRIRNEIKQARLSIKIPYKKIATLGPCQCKAYWFNSMQTTTSLLAFLARYLQTCNRGRGFLSPHKLFLSAEASHRTRSSTIGVMYRHIPDLPFSESPMHGTKYCTTYLWYETSDEVCYFTSTFTRRQHFSA